MGAGNLPHLAPRGQHSTRPGGRELFPFLCRPACRNQPHLLPFPGQYPFPPLLQVNPRWAQAAAKALENCIGLMCPLHLPSDPCAPFTALGWANTLTLHFWDTLLRHTVPSMFPGQRVISNMAPDKGDTAPFICMRTVLKIKDPLSPLPPLLSWLLKRQLLPDGLRKARSQVEAFGLAGLTLLGAVTGWPPKCLQRTLLAGQIISATTAPSFSFP